MILPRTPRTYTVLFCSLAYNCNILIVLNYVRRGNPLKHFAYFVRGIPHMESKWFTILDVLYGCVKGSPGWRMVFQGYFAKARSSYTGINFLFACKLKNVCKFKDLKNYKTSNY